MASTLGVVWARLIHDLSLYEHGVRVADAGGYRQFTDGTETLEEQEERLHSEPAGDSSGPQL